MARIALLQNLPMTERLFTMDQLQKLKTMGEVTINQESGTVTREMVKKLLEDADIAITSWGCPPLDRNVLRHAPHLKAVLHAAGSVKSIVSPDIWERGVRVSSAADALGKGVAETALGLMIVSLKNIWQLVANTKQGDWHKGKSNVREVYGVTVGVIGAGRAGRHFIRLLHHFDVNILLYDPAVTDEEANALSVRKVELETLMSESDVVSIHAPSIPATYKMINKKRLESMKDDAILINTARGTIIDEEALLEQLDKGRLFACLDVTDPEPPAPDHPFRSLPNVILTPHIAGAVNNGVHRVGQYVIDELALYLAGNRMRGEVEPSVLNQLA